MSTHDDATAFWGEVQMLRERMQQDAGESEAAVVNVYLHSGESLQPAVVAPDARWNTFEVPVGGHGGRKVVVVPHGGIARVEIVISPQNKTRALGFSIKEDVAHDTAVRQPKESRSRRHP